MNGFPRYVILPAMLLLAVRAIRNDEDDDDQATASTGAASRSVSQLNTSTDKDSDCSCGGIGFCQHVKWGENGCFACQTECAKTHRAIKQHPSAVKAPASTESGLLSLSQLNTASDKDSDDCTCGGTGMCQHVEEGNQNGCFVCQEECAKTHRAIKKHPSAVKAPASTESGLLSLSQLNTASDKEDSDCTCGGKGMCRHVEEGNQKGCDRCKEECAKTNRAIKKQPSAVKDSLIEESGDAKLTRNPKQVLLEQQGHVKKTTEHAEQQHHVKVAAEHAEKKDDPEKHPEKDEKKEGEDDEKKDEKKDEKTEEKTDDKKVAAKSFAAGRAAHTAVWLVASGVVAYMSA